MKLNLHEIQNIHLALHSYSKLIEYNESKEDTNSRKIRIKTNTILELKDKIGVFLAKEKKKINVDITTEGENNGNS
jgi:hypothetical protein